MNKKIFFLILILSLFFYNYLFSEVPEGKTALIIIDVQDFYFPGGSYPLVDPVPASINAKKMLHSFRKNNLLIIHIRHNVKSGGKIHKNVKPLENEKVISKNSANSFLNTDLDKFLRSKKIKNLIICGMQTHMCVEAAIRAGSDKGYNCTLIHDACATRDLKFKDYIVKAEDVHKSTLSTLRSYAKIMNTEKYLNTFKNE